MTSAGTAPGSLFTSTIAGSSAPTALRAGVLALAVVLTAAAAQFTMPLPFTAVPFALTPMVVLLTGAVLGSRLGCAAQVLYLAAGAAGLPVFAPSATLPPALLRLVGPTGGYLMAYPIAAFATGWLAERGWDRRVATSVAAMLVGLGVIFAGGISWLTVAFTHSLTSALAAGLVPFIALDVLKAVAAAMILPQAWRLFGRRHS